MQRTDDAVLLRQYAENHSDEAFAALVERHVNLVYSVAVRCVGDPHQAEEVAQAVFILLARKAAELRHDKALSSWLFQTTRLTASNFVRSETRRHRRELEAHMQSVLNDPGNDLWPRIAPMLDDAVAELNETDRHAIMLRFYEGRNLREVGVAMGASEDAAEKRVSRAVEKLRAIFAKRGVTAGTSGLVVAISANAVQAAPVGLAVTISTAAALAGTAIVTSTATATATKAIAMTTLQKTLVATALVAAVGTGIYEAHQASTLRNQVSTLQQQQSAHTEQLARDRDEAMRQLAALLADSERVDGNATELLKLRGEVTRLKANAQEMAQLKASNTNDQTLSEAVIWKNRVNQLKQYLEQSPASKIPELQFVTEQDWLDAARAKLDTEGDYRRALSTLRTAGERKFVSMLRKSLTAYMQGNNGELPTDLAQLQPHFDPPVEDAVLQRWEIAPASTVKSLGLGGDVIITQKSPVDDVFDTRFGVGPNGTGSTDFLDRETSGTMRPVREAYRAAHNGQWPTASSQLLPYVATPEQRVALQKLMLRDSSPK